MSHQKILDQSGEQSEQAAGPEQHPVTLENSPEETISRIRSLPERAAKLKESLIRMSFL